MKLQLLFLVTSAAAWLAEPVAAQFDVTLTGEVERLSQAGCNPEATHGIRCTEILLMSSKVDLGALEGQTVKLVGQQDLQIGCVTIDVASAETATERCLQFALFGFRLGRPVTITTFTPIGSTILWLWSCEPGFLPLGTLGTLQLDPFQSVFNPRIDISIGISVRNETIPNDPGLVGATIYYQPAYLTLTGGFGLGVLNSNCFTIRE